VVRRRTKFRHEKIVCNQLETDGFDSYLPTARQSRQWTDRKKLIDFPLLPGYVFVRISEFLSQKTQVLKKVGVSQVGSIVRQILRERSPDSGEKLGGSLGNAFLPEEPPGKSARNPG
jgi:hypothetical protein